MSAARRSRASAPSLRDRLLAEAFALLDAHGPDSVTIRAVARAAGVSHAAPANHFTDRRHLLTDMAASIFADFLALVDQRSRAQPADRARAYLLALFDHAQASPARYGLLWNRDLADWSNPQFLDPLDRAYADYLSALAERHPASGHGAADIETLGTALWSLVHGYASLRATGVFEPRHDSLSGKARLEAMIDLLLDH